jgi:hypothetical protein
MMMMIFDDTVVTPWSRIHFKTLTVTQLLNKFPAFHGTWRLITMFTRSCHWSLSCPVDTLPPYCPKIYCNIILSSTSRSTKWPLPFGFSNQNIVCIFLNSLSCYMPRPSHPPFLDHPNNICEAYKLRSSSLCSQHPVLPLVWETKLHIQKFSLFHSIPLETLN